jgi:Fe-S cluster assembly ATP-binding protein
VRIGRISLAFQYPVEIPGVTIELLKSIITGHRVHRGLPELNALEMLKYIKAKILIDMDADLPASL